MAKKIAGQSPDKVIKEVQTADPDLQIELQSKEVEKKFSKELNEIQGCSNNTDRKARAQHRQINLEESKKEKNNA